MALIDVSSIIQLAYFGSFIVLMFYGQRIQVSMMLVGVKRNLGKLERLRKAAHDSVLSSALRFKGDQKAVESRIDRLTGSFAIQPVSMDPSGIVGKLEHILDTYDDNLRTEVKAIATSATEAEVNTLSNQMEISIGADQMYRVVRNFYLLVTVDAALKFEGEPSGEVAEGVGAAIGGPGVDRYHIEQSASKRHIPMIAIVVKMSNKEAISAMTQQVRLAVDEAIKRVKNTILSASKSGDTVIVAGIGNTMGIP